MGNSLKQLAQKAKSRLKNVSASIETKQKNIGLASHEYSIIATKIKIENDPLFSKVEKLLLKNPDTPSPLKELIDHAEYDNLSPEKQQRYILLLSKKYQEIKQRLILNNFT